MLPIRPVTVAGTVMAGPVGRATNNGFRVAPEVGSRPAALSTAAPATLAAGLLALQAEETPAERNRRAWKRARALLGELQELQAELLGGGADDARLERIAGLCRGEAGADPGLRDAVESLALRAQVELARLGVALAVPPSSN